MALSIPTITLSQVPNPKGIAGSFTTTGSIENDYIISIRQILTNGTVIPAQYVYKFTVSDTCRVVLSNTGSDPKFRSQTVTKVASADNRQYIYIPLASNTEYTIDCNAEYLTIYRNGAATTITYSGIIEYE